MTREEAIKRIQEHMIIHEKKEPRAIYITKALQMAIKALEQTERIAKLVKELDLADISPEYFDDMFYLQSVKEVKEEMWRMYCFAKDVDYTIN